MIVMKRMLCVTTIILFSAACANKKIWNYVLFEYQHGKMDYVRYFDKEKPLIWNNYIIFGYKVKKNMGPNKKGFYIFDKKSGVPVYKNLKGSCHYAIEKDIVYIGEDRLFALDLNTMQENWSQPLDDILISLSLGGGRLFLLPKYNERIIIHDKKTGGWVQNIQDKSSVITFAQKAGTTYYSNGSIVYSVTGKVRKILWKREKNEKGFHCPILSGDTIILFSGRACGLLALDAKTGEILWTLSGVDSLFRGPDPILYNEKLYNVGWNFLTAVDIHVGRIVWQIKPEAMTLPLPFQIQNHNLYWPVMGRNKIYHYNLNTGQLIKEITLNNVITSPFAYENGIMYYCSRTTLYAEEVEL